MGPSLHADAAAKINKTKATLDVGSKLTLKISGTKSKVTWKTDKKAVATVSSKGVVTAKGTGKAIISAKVDKKTFTCAITVKKAYSGWVQYSTDNINNLIDGILNGNIVYIDGKYYCSPEYFEMFSNEEINGNDIPDSTADAINQHTLDPDIEFEIDDDIAEKEAAEEAAEEAALESRINAMLKSGAAVASNEDVDIIENSLNKAYEDFSAAWISETELRVKYQISMDWEWSDKQIQLKLDDYTIYTLENVPFTIKTGELYTFSGIRFQYIDYKFYFNKNDLIAKGIIQ